MRKLRVVAIKNEEIVVNEEYQGCVFADITKNAITIVHMDVNPTILLVLKTNEYDDIQVFNY